MYLSPNIVLLGERVGSVIIVALEPILIIGVGQFASELVRDRTDEGTRQIVIVLVPPDLASILENEFFKAKADYFAGLHAGVNLILEIAMRFVKPIDTIHDKMRPRWVMGRLLEIELGAACKSALKCLTKNRVQWLLEHLFVEKPAEVGSHN